jgi:hypothetical protein
VSPLLRSVWVSSAAFLLLSCNSGVPEPASTEIPSLQLRLTIVRVATDPFLSRHNVTLSLTGAQGCSATMELFPDTGYASRRNLYVTARGEVYIVGQFDARIVDPKTCHITLAEFRHLDRDVSFQGSFDEDADHRWTYFPSSSRAERPFDKRS